MVQLPAPPAGPLPHSARGAPPPEIPALLGCAPDAVMLCDAASFVLDANEEACRSLGYDRGELVGKHVRDFVEGLDDGDRLAELTQLMKERGVATFRARHRRKDGTRFPVETRLALLRRPGASLIVAFARDLSGDEEAARALAEAERARAELAERLRQAEKLEALGTLAGGVAHDFNNVLAAILGHADVLAADLPAGHAGRADVEQIAAAARRARGIVQQILAFARRRPLEPRTLDAARAVGEEMALVRAAMPATIRIALRLDPSAGSVRADPTHLHQLLLNLCANARDAMAPGGGTLEVEVAAARVPAEGAPPGLRPGPHVRLTVRDEGMGMDAATRARALEPYFTTKGPGAGSGLGLSVVHGIATALGGAVSLESAPGRGTAATVWLPRTRADAPAAEVPAPEVVAPRRARVLLVEDDAPVARAMARMLEALGHDVVTCGDGADALARFRADPSAFDLVLTDETLPGLRGDELVPAILAARPDLPAVICTGFSEHVDEERARAVGARALLEKPVDLARLGAVLRAALAG